jgi:hypothetical protein
MADQCKPAAARYGSALCRDFNGHSLILADDIPSNVAFKEITATGEDILITELPPSLESALPNLKDSPTCLKKLCCHPAVPVYIAANLLTPELLSGFWPAKKPAIVAMPKTTMNKNHSSTLGENKIGFSR